MVAHTCKHSTLEAEARDCQFQPPNETLSQQQQQKQNTNKRRQSLPAHDCSCGTSWHTCGDST